MKPSGELYLEQTQSMRLGVDVKEQMRRRKVGGRPQGGRRASLPRGLLASFLTSAPSPLDHVCSKNNSPEGFIPFGLHLIVLFFETLKQGKKQALALGSGLIG